MFQRNTAFHALWHPTYIVYILFNPINTFYCLSFYLCKSVSVDKGVVASTPHFDCSQTLRKASDTWKKGTFWSMQFMLPLLNIMGGYQCFYQNYLVTGRGG